MAQSPTTLVAPLHAALHGAARRAPPHIWESQLCRSGGMLALPIMASNKIGKEHYVMLAEFRYALRQFLRFSENAAHAAGLTPQQHQAMLAIKGYPGREHINIGELAERLQILHHSAVGLVDRLVAQKHARRLRDATDRRQVRVALTARGEAALEKLSEAHREQLSRIGPRIKEILESLQG